MELGQLPILPTNVPLRINSREDQFDLTAFLQQFSIDVNDYPFSFGHISISGMGPITMSEYLDSAEDHYSYGSLPLEFTNKGGFMINSDVSAVFDDFLTVDFWWLRKHLPNAQIITTVLNACSAQISAISPLFCRDNIEMYLEGFEGEGEDGDAPLDYKQVILEAPAWCLSGNMRKLPRWYPQCFPSHLNPKKLFAERAHLRAADCSACFEGQTFTAIVTPFDSPLLNEFAIDDTVNSIAESDGFSPLLICAVTNNNRAFIATYVKNFLNLMTLFNYCVTTILEAIDDHGHSEPSR
jgi:hypothetical protein